MNFWNDFLKIFNDCFCKETFDLFIYFSSDKMTNIVAIIPAYNEEDALADVISKTFNHVDKVIVVNDGSNDMTADIWGLS